MASYNTRLSPTFDDDTPTTVNFSIFVNSFDDISESKMQCEMGLMVRQTWQDDRLKFGKELNDTSLTIDPKTDSTIWVPDLFFVNEKRAHMHDITVPNKLLRIYHNGTVFYSLRISVTLACPMKLHKFPLDTQVCSVELESYAHTTEKIIFRWSDTNAVILSDKLELPQFRLHHFDTDNCTKRYESAGAFPCISAFFVLKRDVCYYLIQTYIPTAMIVVLSWVSFWISVDAVPARISLGVLTILTMTTQSSGIQRSLPRVSYVKAIDVWMAMCLAFVFAALVEFAIVNVLMRRAIKLKSHLKDDPPTDDEEENHLQNNLNNKAFSGRTRPKRGSDRYSIGHLMRRWKAVEVDQFSRTVFPLVFVLFNIIYWSVYLLWQDDYIRKSDTNTVKAP